MQSGTEVSGTLTVISIETDVTGSVSGASATVSGTFPLDPGGTIEYVYEGTVSDTAYSGTVALTITLPDGTVREEQGQFSVTRESSSPTPTPTPTPGALPIDGTVTAPEGYDVLNTIVAACASEACNPEVDGASDGTQITTSGTSSAYTVYVAAGQYTVIAIQDINGNRILDAGDLLGAYPSVQAPTAVSAPMSNVDISLVEYVGGTGSTAPATFVVKAGAGQPGWVVRAAREMLKEY